MGFKAHNPKYTQKEAGDDDRDTERDNMISSLDESIRVGETWGIDKELWDRNWSNLSGGEAQRISLAAAVGLGTAEILLLDGQFLP